MPQSRLRCGRLSHVRPVPGIDDRRRSRMEGGYPPSMIPSSRGRRLRSGARLLLALAPLAGAPAQGYDPRSTPTALCGQGTPALWAYPARGTRRRAWSYAHGAPGWEPAVPRREWQRGGPRAAGAGRSGAAHHAAQRNHRPGDDRRDRWLTTGNTRVPDSADFYPVIPGMRHHATGATTPGMAFPCHP
jgi:hypothetical protein